MDCFQSVHLEITLKNEVKKCNLQGSEASCHDRLQDITLEEVGELRKELKLIFDKQAVESSSLDELDTSFEIDKTRNHTTHEDIASKGSPYQRSSSAVLSRGKDRRLDSDKSSFLLKKMFLYSSGFTPTPSLRDPLPESRLEKSRMEKILRAILNKKIYPQKF